MSSLNRAEMLAIRADYLLQWPEATQECLDNLFPLPSSIPSGQDESKSQPRLNSSTGPRSPANRQRSKRGAKGDFGNPPSPKRSYAGPEGEADREAAKASEAPNSALHPVLSNHRLADAERRRQNSIRESITEYLRLYPSVDTSQADRIFKDSHKSDIYQVVVELMRDKRVPLVHFQEAFDFFSWLAGHEPSAEDDKTRRTLLHYACAYGRSDVLGLLLEPKYQAKINARDEKGYCLLHHAAQSGDLDCLALALNAASHLLEQRDSEHRTPLMIAAFFNQKEVAVKLLERGANLAARDNTNSTVIQIAQKQGHLALAAAAKVFQEQQSAKNARDNAIRRWMSTPLRGRLYRAWQQSTVPHTSVPVGGQFVFNATPAHSVEADNIELVRMGRYDVSNSQRNYFAQRARHNELFLCLAYLAAPLICSPSDCQKQLSAYEAVLQSEGAVVEVHPLYFLACVRMVRDDLVLRKALLMEFAKKYPTSLGLTVDKGGWLTLEEEGELNAPDSPTKRTEAPRPETLKEKWERFVKTARLKPDQRSPMDELLKLTGLAAVKELAYDLYIEGQENGFAPPGEDAVHREYNFAFLGNPGTGKTTVARILAKILEATGLRAGHKVIEMTASDALRKGVQQFSTEISALTGGGSSIAPPPNPKLLRKGMNVEVKHGQKWFPATISSVQKGKVPKPAPPPSQTQPQPPQQQRQGNQSPPVEYETVGVYELTYPDGTVDTDMTAFHGTDQVIRPVSRETAAGGVLFLDEAYDLDPTNLREGRHIMADIMKVAEDCRDKVSIILAGYKDDVANKLYAYNSGMRDRFRSIAFEDFDEDELLEVWEGMVRGAGWTAASLPGQMSVSRVAARRLSQRRSMKGFANARSVRVLCNQAITAAKRRPNHNKTLIVEDVIGVPPTPERIPALAAALRTLHEHIGIKQVKEAVGSICDIARKNYDKELNGMKVDRIPLNRLFLGNPGTGKTTVAAIYGQILKQLMLLSKGDVIERKASDFIGAVVGGTEEKTKGILALAKGCVLIIDEAYNLNDQLFGKIALNTIVENVNNAPGDDIAVILIGYEKQMLRMLDEQNPGLRSRFDPAYAFRFEDFSDLELLQIFSSACAKDQLDVPIDIKCAAVRHLAKARCMKHFGNARAVMTLVGAAKNRMNSRIQRDPSGAQSMTLEDVLGENAQLKANPLQCIEELQGGDDELGFRTVLKQLGSSISLCRLENRPVDAVGNFIFTGAPGTGKTTVASKMAKMLNAFGVLASDHVVITSALDLTGEYVGQSKKVIEAKMEEARGGVLFIDEAYKLGEGSYGDEVMVKLLGMLTEPEYSGGKTIVILAGYDADMHRMLARNPGMASRFNERIHFSDWGEAQCADLVEHMGRSEKPVPFHFEGDVRSILLQGFRALLARPNWANARDSETMYKFLKKARDRRRSKELESAQVNSAPTPGAALFFTVEDARQAVELFLRSRPEATRHRDAPNLQQRLADLLGGNGHHPFGGRAAEGDGPNKPPPAPPAFETHTAAHQKTDHTPPPVAEDAEEEEDHDHDHDHDHDGTNGGEDIFAPEKLRELQRKQAEYESQCAANRAELTELEGRAVAAAAEAEERLRQAEEEDRRLEELSRQRQQEREAELAEMQRREEKEQAMRAKELERIRQEQEVALRLAEEAKRAELARQQAALLEKLRAEEEAQKAEAARRREERRRALEEAERARKAELDRQRLEEAKRRAAEERRRQEELARERARIDALRRQQEEERRQQAIRSLGRCSAGYVWNKVAGGYRCAGGSHFIPDHEVERRYKELFPNA